jgi:hypothetical protein
MNTMSLDRLTEEQATVKTGWPPGMLQDDSRELSRWLANRPGARLQVSAADLDARESEREAALRAAVCEAYVPPEEPCGEKCRQGRRVGHVCRQPIEEFPALDSPWTLLVGAVALVGVIAFCVIAQEDPVPQQQVSIRVTT